MRDCWLSPYGEVVYCSGKWDHSGTAWKIMEEKLGLDIEEMDELDIKYGSLTAGLESLGWIRYSTLPNYKTGGYEGLGWVIKEGIILTTEQKDKMFELTGKIVEQ